MKKLICILLTLSLLLLCGCGEESGADNSDIAAEADSAVERANSETRLEGEYMLEITFGAGSVLYYALGDIAWDRSENRVFAEFGQTYLGASDELLNYFSDGQMTSVQDGSVITVERDSEELFSKFPYFKLPKTEGDIILGSNSSGTTYGFKIADSKTLSEAIVGGDIYDLAAVLKKPQKELTEYSEANCVYTVKDGKIISARYEYDIKLFDTPSYNPNYSQPEEEYTIDIHVTAKVTYDNFGEGIKIAEYSEETDISEVSE